MRAIVQTKAHDPIGTDKESNEITLIDILGYEADDVIKEVDLRSRRARYIVISIYWMPRKGSCRWSFWIGYRWGREDAAGDREGAWDLAELCFENRKKDAHEAVS